MKILKQVSVRNCPGENWFGGNYREWELPGRKLLRVRIVCDESYPGWEFTVRHKFHMTEYSSMANVLEGGISPGGFIYQLAQIFTRPNIG